MLRSPLKDQSEADQIRRDVDILSQSTDHVWLMARIASLLHPYYAGSASKAAVKMMAEDWAVELGDFPQWAVTKAVRWWKSADNPERKRKPLEGDIAARCKTEMGIVRLAEGALRRYDQGGRPEAEPIDGPEREDPWNLTDEQRAHRRSVAAEVMSGLPDSMKVPKPQSQDETQRNINAARAQAEEAENVGSE